MANRVVMRFVVHNANRFSRTLREAGDSMNELQKGANALAAASRRAFVASGAAFGAIVYRFAQFEQRMDGVKAILADFTDQEMPRLIDRARELGKETVFTANQMADAMQQFALQGFTANDVFEAMDDVANLAAAGHVDLAKAARISSGVMRSMGMGTSELNHIVDVLAFSVTRSANTVPLLGEAFKNLGPVAAAAGVSLEEVTATLNVTANSMIRGGMAGTQLRNLIQRLTKKQKEVREALEEVNISTQDQQGNFVGLIDIVRQLETATTDMTATERNFIITRIAGMRANATLLALYKKGSTELERLKMEMEDVAGLAKLMADTRLANLAGEMTILISKINDLAIAFGDELAPSLKAMVDAAQWVTDVLAEMPNFAKKGIGVLLGTFTALTAVASTVGTVVTLAAVGFNQLARATRGGTVAGLKFGAAFKSILRWVGRVTVALWALYEVINAISVALDFASGTSVEKYRRALGRTSDMAKETGIALKELKEAQSTGDDLEKLHATNAVIAAIEKEIAANQRLIESTNDFVMNSEQEAQTHEQATRFIELLKKKKEELTEQAKDLNLATKDVSKSSQTYGERVLALRRDVHDLTEALKEEVATFGMASDRAKFHMLILRGLQGPQKRVIEMLIEHKEKLEALAEADKKAAEAAEDHANRRIQAMEGIAELQDKIEILMGRMTEVQARTRQLFRGGMDITLAKQTAELEAQVDALTQQQRQWKKFQAAIAKRKQQKDKKDLKSNEFKAEFVGLTQLHKRIQAAAASGKKFDPQGAHLARLKQLQSISKKSQQQVTELQNLRNAFEKGVTRFQ